MVYNVVDANMVYNVVDVSVVYNVGRVGHIFCRVSSDLLRFEM